MHRKLLLIIFLGFYYSNYCQDLIYNSFTSDVGLPGNEVFDLVKDNFGRIWGGTDGGLFCYDGDKFIVYTTQDGLSDNSVLKLYLDQFGRLWMSCFNGTISYLENDSIVPLACNKEIQSVLEGLFITSMTVDENKNLKLGYNQGCLIVYAQLNYTKFHIKSEEISYSLFDQARAYILPDPNSDFFVYSSFKRDFKTENILFIFGSEKVQIKMSDYGLENNFSGISNLAKINDDSILFSVNNILFLYSSNSISVQQKFEYKITNVSYIDQKIWISTLNDGIRVYENATQHEILHLLKGYSVSSLQVDNEGGIWMGTLGDGLLYCANPNILLYRHSTSRNNGVVSVIASEDKVYALTENSLIISLTTAYQNPDTLIQVVRNRIDAGKIQLNQNQILVASDLSGYFDLTENTKSNLTFQQREISATDIVRTDDGDYLAAYQYLLRVSKNEIERHQAPSRTRCLLVTDSGKILVGTLNGIFEFSNDTFTPFMPELFNNVRINNMHKWEDLILVSTASRGLVAVSNSGAVKFSLGLENGLISNNCFQSAIYKDDLWIISKQGLSRIHWGKSDTLSFTASNYTVADGLPANELLSLTFQNDYLWLATNKGLCCITDINSLMNEAEPIVQIKKAYINNSLWDYEDKNELDYTENNILIQWTSNAFRNGQRAGCRYKLTGYDAHNRFSNNGIIQYENLPPGDYQLKLTALNNQGKIGQNSILVQFKIHAPFWQRAWFIATLMAAFFSGFYLLFRWRMNGVKKNEHKQRMIERQMNELRLMATRAQMNPHFIFNAVNGIQRFILEKRSEEAYHYLTRFSKLIRFVLENASENFHSIAKEIEIVGLYVELEQLRFENKFQFELQIDEQVDLEHNYIPSLLLQPIVENSIWHGLLPQRHSTNNKLKIEITQTKDSLYILISDNGVGINHKKNQRLNSNKKSMGIELVRERLKLIAHDSKLSINSINEGGTSVEIIISINFYDKY